MHNEKMWFKFNCTIECAIFIICSFFFRVRKSVKENAWKNTFSTNYWLFHCRHNNSPICLVTYPWVDLHLLHWHPCQRTKQTPGGPWKCSLALPFPTQRDAGAACGTDAPLWCSAPARRRRIWPSEPPFPPRSCARFSCGNRGSCESGISHLFLFLDSDVGKNVKIFL